MDSKPESTLPSEAGAARKKRTPAFVIIACCLVGGLLIAIVLPNWIAAQKKAKNAAIKGNMRSVQIAAESYGTDSGGPYASTLSELAPYLPGGSNTIGGRHAPGYSFKKISKFADLELLKDGDLVDIGQISPSAFNSWIRPVPENTQDDKDIFFTTYRPKNSSYEIMGLKYRNKTLYALVGGIGGKPLVLSNQ